MLYDLLFKIKDHRRGQGRRYLLGHILFFSVLALLSGATSYRKVHAFIKANYVLLDETFALHWNRLPAYTTIRDIIQGVFDDDLEERFREYSNRLLDDSQGEKRFVSFDGKVLRGSFDHFSGQSAIQVLSAFLTTQRIILAHEEIATKTNEIPTAQEMMPKLGLSGCVFTFDAINCQENTLKVGKETGNDVIVQVKGNQKTLFNDCQTLAESSLPSDKYEEPIMKGHNRIEGRSVQVFPRPTFSDDIKWRLVDTVVKVDRTRWTFNTRSKVWEPSHETSFYISTICLTAKDFCQAIRNHWSIENGNHYVRDVSLGEDRSRIRTNPHIFAKLRSFALNIFRFNNVKNVSMELFANCMNLSHALNYIGIC
jgi:predicted transposase YbfD/YdcC